MPSYSSTALFTAGKTYSNAPTNYGLRPYDQLNNSAASGIGSITLLCVRATKSYGTFKRLQPTGTGPTYNPGMLTGETLHLPIRRDATGYYVEPLGRRRGGPVSRPY